MVRRGAGVGGESVLRWRSSRRKFQMVGNSGLRRRSCVVSGREVMSVVGEGGVERRVRSWVSRVR